MNVEDALKGIPGLLIRNLDGAPPVIDLRGAGMASSLTSTLLLLNGVPLSGVRVFDVNSIPVSEIERIEIIQGGGALMYGDGAAGGVVNIITQTMKNKKYYGNVDLEYGSWKTGRIHLGIGGQMEKNFSLQASYSGYSSMDWRDRAHGIDMSGKTFDYRHKKDRKDSFWLSGKKEGKDQSIELRYSHMKSKDYFTTFLNKKQYEENPKQAGMTGNYIEDVTDIWNLSYHKKWSDKLDFLLYGGYHHGKNENQHFLMEEYFVTPQIKYLYGNNSYVIVSGDIRNGKREWKDTFLLNGKKAPNDTRKSKAYADDDFKNEFSKENSYTTWDLHLSYHFQNGMEIYGGAKNLLDKKYAHSVAIMRSPFASQKVYHPANGRNVYVGFKYRF